MASIFTLDIGGTVLALVFGALTFVFGLSLWWFFVIVLVDFLVLSAIATRALEEQKARMKGYEKVRGWKNVVANGLVPLIIVFFYFLNSTYNYVPKNVVIYVFVASVCAIVADKFASEFGVLNGEPVMLLTMKKARRGTSGAITGFGTLMGLVASAFIGLTIFAIGGSLAALVLLIASGFVGNIVDSIFGYFEEKKIGNKYTSNLLCSIAGALFCYLVLYFAPVIL